jgi:hypothetical protein
MLLRGEFIPEGQPLVVNADPGMEDSRTYDYVTKMKVECAKAGIEFITAPGPNLYHDLLNAEGKKRLDNPGYYVTNPDGKTGKLMQACTKAYKIAPMNRVVRNVLHRDFGVNPRGIPPERSVELIIGFHAGEWHRCSQTGAKFSYFRYPLIEMQMDDAMVAGYYMKHGLPKPPRSVCNACFANDIKYFREMHANRPTDWAKAVEVDNAIRHGLPGVKGEAFTNRYRIPLEDLPMIDFLPTGYDPGKEKEETCNQGGHCFI